MWSVNIRSNEDLIFVLTHCHLGYGNKLNQLTSNTLPKVIKLTLPCRHGIVLSSGR